ncbi:MAG: hypothetical protein GY750_15830 [Lentisphaerae bacterium]|nr:hypothetical protein [Lentisphaerota bacterium]MCP4102868.1 hypothetical protein [Lentisphaerota bacterium]
MITVKTERSIPKYKVGEEITFLVSVPDDSEAVDYTVSINRIEVIASGNIQPGSEKIKITAQADRPCFVEISIPVGEEVYEAAAAIAPEEITVTSIIPEGFAQFWKEKLDVLNKVPLKVELKKIAQMPDEKYQEWHDEFPVFGNCPLKHNKIDVCDFKTPHYRGFPVRGYMAKPSEAKPKSLPAVLFTHGAGITDSDIGKVNGAAKLGFLSMDINAHGLLNGQPSEYYLNFAAEIQEHLGNYFKNGRLDKDASYIPELLLRHRKALDVLCAQPEWDGKTLIIRGASQGGFLAVACAALDPRVTAIFAGVPGLCDATLEFNLQTWLLEESDTEEVANIVRETSKFASLAYFAPEIKAEAWFDVAYLDKLCHPAAFYAMYNVYGGPKHLYEGYTAGHGDIPHEVVFDQYTKEMLKIAELS